MALCWEDLRGCQNARDPKIKDPYGETPAVILSRFDRLVLGFGGFWSRVQNYCRRPESATP